MKGKFTRPVGILYLVMGTVLIVCVGDTLQKSYDSTHAPYKFTVRCLPVPGCTNCLPSAQIICVQGVHHDKKGLWTRGQTDRALEFCDNDQVTLSYASNSVAWVSNDGWNSLVIEGYYPKATKPASSLSAFLPSGFQAVTYTLHTYYDKDDGAALSIGASKYVKLANQ